MNGKPHLNGVLYSGRCAALTLFSTLFSTTVLHGALLARGVSAYQLGVIGTLESAANVLCLFLFSGLSDRFTRFGAYKRATALLMSGMLLRALAVWALFGRGESLPKASFFGAYLLITFLSTAAYALYGMLDISMVVRVTRTGREVTRLTGVAGVAGGVMSLVTGFYIRSSGADMPALALLAAGASALAILLTLLLRAGRAPDQAARAPASPFRAIKTVARMPAFRALLPANLLRGVQYAAVYFMASVGIARFSGSAGTLALAAACAPLVSYLLLTFLSHAQPRKMYAAGCCAAALALVVLATAKSAAVFAAGYFALYVGQALIEVCFPLGMYQIVPVETLGAFSAVRLLLYTLASTLAIYLFGFLVDRGSAYLVFALGVAALAGGARSFYRALSPGRDTSSARPEDAER